jgi:hypothetical protein
MRRLLVLLALALALAACDSDQKTVKVTVTETQILTQTQTVEAEPVLTVKTSDVALEGPTFQMPSKNIGCTQGEGVLVCDVLSGLKPEPDQECELDWTGMEMERLGPSQPRCAGDTAYDQSAPVLEYGEAWQRNGFLCVSMTTGLDCTNEDSHGFTLSRERWTQF